MSYIKTVWQAGDTITSEKLNNIENGVEAASQLAPATVTIPVYYVVDAATEQTYIDDISGVPGARVNFAKTGYGAYTLLSIKWGNTNGTGIEAYYCEHFIDRDGNLAINSYVPNVIPKPMEGEYDRIIITLNN